MLAPSNSRPWTEEEDRTVCMLVLSHGTKQWSLIAARLHGRTGNQCRERWHKGNHSSEALFASTPVQPASEAETMFAAAWQHEEAAAIQRQMRGWRATTGNGRPKTGWRTNQEVEMRNARLLQETRDLKAANAELKTKLQTELQRAHTASGRTAGAASR